MESIPAITLLACKNKAMGYSFILLDLDGTISDPIEGIWRSFNFALEHYGYEVIARKNISQYIGPPLDETFIKLADTSDPSHIKELVAKYRERFSRTGYKENELYPGIREALQILTDQNIQLGICTSKREDFAIKILKMFGLYNFFSVVSGGDIGIKKVGQIKQLLAHNQIPQNTIMVGDRAVDLLSAHQNQLKSAGVLWGYGSKEELEEQEPNFLLKNPEDLLLLA